MASKRDIQDLLDEAEAAGCRVDSTGKHHKVYCPDGASIVVVPCTPSDHRAVKNARAQLRRAGVNIPSH